MYMPAFMPAAPKPLSARPMMNAVDVGAAAVRSVPITKTTNENM